MENIKQLLELNIEIEGLLRVAEYRKSDVAESLLLAKSKEFFDILNAAISDNKSYPDATMVIPSIPTLQTETNTIVEDIISAIPDNENNTVKPLTGSSDDISDTSEVCSDVMSEEIETVLEMDIPVQEIKEYDTTGTPAPPAFNHASAQNKDEEDNLDNNQDELPPSKDPSSESNRMLRIDEMIHRQSSRDLKKAFSLNDRFRYIREIFDNDANYFDETINNLEMLSNLDEVYDYLLGDIGLNHEDETVKDFLAIIYNHFNA